ncbi:MAG: hypothetical protein A3B96_00320 [Candidatus Spechtbacteria bacterium RIFCSPHIGHO2_02_FULL_43_15b]|uniref:Type 4a pilus biogenesis protein PilO n=1 Tax=Candidatus Spechtbacteria bacterium RIFCSPHIGHO2_01_FULL_43_30 TaxID=1802158 RepID=A0A1G2H5H8_9BACT|nr:MAG: hypothetical protein A2827_00740 [Candidatus Spechtbacteria bacterium RIFCSPHIGHO2_01_FULL_43_30]OGZ59321.1 MAG: hypothetical protein A3B96_00320 [Candidatus Spechtbacteria bacterium RIFCSPHIGHO2_02_FULL_43_15b]
MTTNGKNGLIFIFIGLLCLSMIGYFAYYLLGRVNSHKESYSDKKKELVVLEERKKQSQQLRDDLVKLSDDAEKINEAFLGAGFDDTVNFTIQVEDIAKTLGIQYEINIARNATNIQPSSIKDLPVDRVLDTFPHIVFKIDLESTYADLVKFIEGLNRMPYYINIERLDIRKSGIAEEGGVVLTKATLQVKVFTHEIKPSN